MLVRGYKFRENPRRGRLYFVKAREIMLRPVVWCWHFLMKFVPGCW